MYSDREREFKCDAGKLEVEVNGNVPKIGGVIILKDWEIISDTLDFGNGTNEEPQRMIGKAVTAENKTVAGNIPQGNYEPGDEYIINVDGTNEYHFYVLSTEGDKVNLIMSNNICSDGTLATADNKCLMAWISNVDYNDNTNYGNLGNNNKGPITAMNYLYQATKKWSKIENIQMNYNDEGNTGSYGYGGITTNENVTRITMKNGTETATYNNLKARLIKQSEIEKTGCTNTSGSCPAWLVNGLSTYTSKYPEGTKEDISNILGYWSLSSSVSGSDYARFIGYGGHVFSFSVSNDVYYGLRPVITVSESDLS